MTKRYLITGGAGFLGINLIRHLLQKGHPVTSLDVADFDYPDVIDKVTIIKGDIRDMTIVDKAMQSIDIVVHAAAALPLYTKEDIFSTDVNGTRNIIDSAHRHSVDRLIHISTTAVYGIPDHHPLYEEDKLDGVGPYGQAKILAEEICLAYRKKGMCIPILRPKSFIGPERLGVFALFYDWARDARGFPVIGSGKNRYQYLDVEDLCHAIYLCATGDKEKVNDIFNIGAKEFSTVKEDFQAVLNYAGFGKKVQPLPALPIILTLRMLDLFRLSPLYKWVYETVSKDSFVSIEKARWVLGYAPKYSNQDALIRNYQWYLHNIEQIEHTSGISHRVPWKQGVLRFAKVFF